MMCCTASRPCPDESVVDFVDSTCTQDLIDLQWNHDSKTALGGLCPEVRLPPLPPIYSINWYDKAHISPW